MAKCVLLAEVTFFQERRVWRESSLEDRVHCGLIPSEDRVQRLPKRTGFGVQ